MNILIKYFTLCLILNIIKTEDTNAKSQEDRLELESSFKKPQDKQMPDNTKPPIPLWMTNINSEYYGKDQRCGGYNMVKSCKFCYNSYFNPKINKCTVPLTKIENCLFYLDEEYCINCELGYHMDRQQKKCIKNEIENCKNEFEGKCMVTKF